MKLNINVGNKERPPETPAEESKTVDTAVKAGNGPELNPFTPEEDSDVKQVGSDEKPAERVHTEQEFAKTAEGISDGELNEINPFENATEPVQRNSFVQ